MRKILIFILSLITTVSANAEDMENRADNMLKFGKWFVVEFTMPTTMTYRIGAESNLPEQKETLFIDISPLNKCEVKGANANQFIGYKQMDFTDTPFIPAKYKISGQDEKDVITKPVVSDGFLFTPIDSLTINELLKAKDKGNLSFWIQPPAESHTTVNKMFFPLNGFTNAYNKAIQLCKDNM